MSNPQKSPTSPPKSPLRGANPRDLFLLKKQGRHLQQKRGVEPLKLQRTGYKTPPSMRSPISPGRSVECGGYRRTDCELHEQAETYVRSIIMRKRREDKRAGGIRSEAMARMREETSGDVEADEDGDEEQDEHEDDDSNLLDKFPTPPGHHRHSSWSSIELRSIIGALEGVMAEAETAGGNFPDPEDEAGTDLMLMLPSAEHKVRVHETAQVSDGAQAMIESPAVDEVHKQLFKSILRSAKDRPGDSTQTDYQRASRVVMEREKARQSAMNLIVEPDETASSILRTCPTAWSLQDQLSLHVALNESEDSVLPPQETLDLDARRENWKARKEELKRWLDTGHIPDQYYERAGKLPPDKGKEALNHE